MKTHGTAIHQKLKPSDNNNMCDMTHMTYITVLQTQHIFYPDFFGRMNNLWLVKKVEY